MGKALLLKCQDGDSDDTSLGLYRNISVFASSTKEPVASIATVTVFAFYDSSKQWENNCCKMPIRQLCQYFPWLK
jgi:hypothetical protein